MASPSVHLIFDSIRELTGRSYDAESFTENDTIFQFGIDSLSIIEFIFLLEEKLGIDIPLSELNEEIFKSVLNLAAHLDQLKSNNSPALQNG